MESLEALIRHPSVSASANHHVSVLTPEPNESAVNDAEEYQPAEVQLPGVNLPVFAPVDHTAKPALPQYELNDDSVPKPNDEETQSGDDDEDDEDEDDEDDEDEHNEVSSPSVEADPDHAAAQDEALASPESAFARLLGALIGGEPEHDSNEHDSNEHDSNEHDSNEHDSNEHEENDAADDHDDEDDEEDDEHHQQHEEEEEDEHERTPLGLPFAPHPLMFQIHFAPMHAAVHPMMFVMHGAHPMMMLGAHPMASPAPLSPMMNPLISSLLGLGAPRPHAFQNPLGFGGFPLPQFHVPTFPFPHMNPMEMMNPMAMHGGNMEEISFGPNGGSVHEEGTRADGSKYDFTLPVAKGQSVNDVLAKAHAMESANAQASAQTSLATASKVAQAKVAQAKVVPVSAKVVPVHFKDAVKGISRDDILAAIHDLQEKAQH